MNIGELVYLFMMILFIIIRMLDAIKKLKKHGKSMIGSIYGR